MSARNQKLLGSSAQVPPAGRERGKRARNPEAKTEVRKRILNGAVELFSSAGYAAFSMRRLAAQLNYAPNALYGYFANKDDLLLAVVGEGWELMRGYIAAAPALPAENRLHAVGMAYLNFAFENPSLYRLMFLQRPGDRFDFSEESVRSRTDIMMTVVEAVRSIPALSHIDAESSIEAAEAAWIFCQGAASLVLTMSVLFDEQWARRRLVFFLNSLSSGVAAAGAMAHDTAATPSVAMRLLSKRVKPDNG